MLLQITILVTLLRTSVEFQTWIKIVLLIGTGLGDESAVLLIGTGLGDGSADVLSTDLDEAPEVAEGEAVVMAMAAAMAEERAAGE